MGHNHAARGLVFLVAGVLASSGLRALGAENLPDSVRYDRSIRPILSNNCYKCHGPDSEERKSGLRLDLREGAVDTAESGSHAVVPGKPEESELVRRIFSEDDDERMPPPDSNKKLTAGEKELLKRWIAEGALFQQHWSFVTPQRPDVPAVKDASWPRGAIDRFILVRLESEGLHPSPEADRTTLIRRLTLDLTGLPPTPTEVDAFLADTSADAYETVVDRLLDSPHYGERMALEWLDAARYADTHGYHIDSGRDMTRWREWVISAFNGNMPFDRFTVEQLAGDLLPDATLQQRIASGFNRNHMINFEGGAIPEEYHNAYVVDRVNTTTSVWLGLTVGCAQCHDHKFDPLTQKEFYQLYAFFNHVPENGLDGNKGNAAPVLKTPSQDQQAKLDSLNAQIAALESKLREPLADADAAQAAWEADPANRPAIWKPLASIKLTSHGGATLSKLDDGSVRAEGANPATDTYIVTSPLDDGPVTAIRLEGLTDEPLAAKGPGRAHNGNLVLTDFRASKNSADPTAPAVALKFKSAWADFSQQNFPIAQAIDDQPQTGWAILPETGKPHVAVFELDEPLQAAPETTLTVVLDFQSQFGQHQLGRFRLAHTSAKDVQVGSGLPGNIRAVLEIAREGRSPEQQTALREYYRSQVWPAGKQFSEQLSALRKELAELDGRIPTAMVMQEMPQPRDTFLLLRGQYDKTGEKVSAGVPAVLPPLPQGAPANRLGLAQWLVDPSHPLTSRVIVNRFWQMYFGTGLVKTSEDFGSQGEPPTHPALLDWLAVEFMNGPQGSQGSSGVRWNVKALQRLIVTSAAYRQSSKVPAELLAKDPENRLVARASRLRLPAELIRDQALWASGLLNDAVGGASVSPYQPPGIWEELASREDGANWTAQVYSQSHGRDLYRRTMYTYWKRTAPPPSLMTFDAPDRETCVVRRSRTNTPLQALVLLNDPTYVEASRKMAERVLTENDGSTGDRVRFAFRLITARVPTEKEIAVLAAVHDAQHAHFRQETGAAEKLLSVGESARNEQLEPAELAAWSVVASMILNLDEAVTRS